MLATKQQVLTKRSKNPKISSNSIYHAPSVLPVEVMALGKDQPFHPQEQAIRYRSTHFEIIYIKEGSCLTSVDADQYEITPSNLGFIHPGQIVQLLPQNNVQGYVLRFTQNFLNSSVEKSTMINHNISAFSCLPALHITESDKIDLNLIIDNISKQYKSLAQSDSQMFRKEVISGLLKVFLIYLSKIVSAQPNPKSSYRTEIIDKFFLLLEEKFKTEKSPSYYANQLNLSSNHLTNLLRKNTGFTTSYYIAQRIIIEAKRLTIYSNSNMKEISFQLGFADTAHFSKLFKRVSGQTFTQYRQALTAI